MRKTKHWPTPPPDTDHNEEGSRNRAKPDTEKGKGFFREMQGFRGSQPVFTVESLFPSPGHTFFLDLIICW